MALPAALVAGLKYGGAGVGGYAVSKGVGDTLGAVGNLFTPSITTSKQTGGGNNYANYISGYYQFFMETMAPPDNELEALDNFFDAYGYNLQTFKKPVLNVRAPFTYVKTQDAKVRCINLNAALQMAELLNSGCKFWSN